MVVVILPRFLSVFFVFCSCFLFASKTLPVFSFLCVSCCANAQSCVLQAKSFCVRLGCCLPSRSTGRGGKAAREAEAVTDAETSPTPRDENV